MQITRALKAENRLQLCRHSKIPPFKLWQRSVVNCSSRITPINLIAKIQKLQDKKVVLGDPGEPRLMRIRVVG